MESGGTAATNPPGEVYLSTETEAHEVVLLPGSGVYENTEWPRQPYLST
jgi:hypothetical protein